MTDQTTVADGIATQYEADVITKRMRIAARPETVFPFFTETAKLTQWLAVEAELEAQPGGVCRQVHRADDGSHHTMAGEFVVVEPPHRVVFTWGYEELAVPPGASRVEVDLQADGEGGTLLTLAHHGLRAMREGHDKGWSQLLPGLAEAAERAERADAERP